MAITADTWKRISERPELQGIDPARREQMRVRLFEQAAQGLAPEQREQARMQWDRDTLGGVGVGQGQAPVAERQQLPLVGGEAGSTLQQAPRRPGFRLADPESLAEAGAKERAPGVAQSRPQRFTLASPESFAVVDGARGKGRAGPERDSAWGYSVDRAQQLVGSGIESTGRLVGSGAVERLGQRIVARQERDIAAGGYQPEYTGSLRETLAEGGVGDAAGWLGEKIAENWATTGAGIAGGIAAIATAPLSVPAALAIGAGTVGTQYLMSVGEVADEIEERGAGQHDALAALAGAGIAALDRIGLGRWLPKAKLSELARRLPGMTGGELIQELEQAGAREAAEAVAARIQEGATSAGRGILARTGRAAGTEAVTEAAQEGISMGAAASQGGTYTPGEVVDRLIDSAVLGGAIGGAVAPVVGSRYTPEQERAQALQDPQASPRARIEAARTVARDLRGQSPALAGAFMDHALRAIANGRPVVAEGLSFYEQLRPAQRAAVDREIAPQAQPAGQGSLAGLEAERASIVARRDREAQAGALPDELAAYEDEIARIDEDINAVRAAMPAPHRPAMPAQQAADPGGRADADGVGSLQQQIVEAAASLRDARARGDAAGEAAAKARGRELIQRAERMRQALAQTPAGRQSVAVSRPVTAPDEVAPEAGAAGQGAEIGGGQGATAPQELAGRQQAEAPAIGAAEIGGEARAPIRFQPAPDPDDVAITPAGREVPVRYALVEASDLVASQTDDGRTNPRYPAEMQPRDRGRGVSALQVQRIAQELNPRLLDRSPRATDGAPIVSQDGTVESGNGRVLAIRQAYGRGLESARAYREYLASQGYPVDGLSQPVLVRLRTGDLSPQERQAFTREANERDTLDLSATERAMADAEALPGDLLDLYRGGDVDAAANRDFVRAFIERVVGRNETARMVASDGAITQEGVRRVELALLARAYGDGDLVAGIAESIDSNIRAIGGALLDVAPAWAQMREAAADGMIDPAMDQTARLLDAVRLVQRARREGRSISDLIGQADILSGEAVHPVAEAFLRLMYRNTMHWKQPTGRDRLAGALRDYIESASRATPGIDLLGDAAPDPAAILAAAKERQYDGNEPAEADLLAQPAGRPGRDDGGTSAAGEGPGATAAETPRGGAPQRTGGAGASAQADERELTPGAQGLEAAANEAATSPSNGLPEPTAAQKEAGNYKVGKVRLHGLEISIENPRGSVRRGVDDDGRAWENRLAHHYGYINRTEGADGDHVDVFVGPNPESERVFVVDQRRDGGDKGPFDEHKVLLGFDDRDAAVAGYLANYENGWQAGPVTEMSVDGLKSWLQGDTSKPVATPARRQKSKPEAAGGGVAAKDAPDTVREDPQNEREASDIQGRKGATPAAKGDEAGRGEQLGFDLSLPETPAAKRAAIADIFAVEVKARPVSRLRSGVDSIRSSEDLAHLVADIRRDAQEALYVVATDESGKVLRVMLHTVGTKSESIVDALTIVAEAAGIEGAAEIHLAHNHPAGNPEPSGADRAVTRSIDAALDGTGIRLASHVVIGRSTWASFGPESTSHDIGAHRPLARKHSIDVTRRKLGPRRTTILGDAPVNAATSSALLSGMKGDGVLLLNNRHVPSAFVYMTSGEMKALRGGAARRLLAAADRSNASGIIIKTDDQNAAQNLIRFLNNYNAKGLRLLDWIRGGKSVAEQSAHELQETGPFFSKRTERFALGQQTEADIRAQEQERRAAEKKAAERKKRDEAPPASDFELTGSDRPADRNPKQGALFSRSAKTDNTLIAQHNLTAKNLAHAKRMGGLAAPSIAITDVSRPINGFGEITLLADAQTVDPRRGAKVFGADIYSPRYPDISYRLSNESLSRLGKLLAPYAENKKVAFGVISDASELASMPEFRAYVRSYTREKYPDFEQEAHRTLREVGAEERLFKGFTKNGRRYVPHTLENVIKELKRDIRGGESFNYGLPSLRAKVTPQFRSITALKQEVGRLVTREDFERARDDATEELFKLADAVQREAGTDAMRSLDTTTGIMLDAVRIGIPRALKEYGAEGVSPETQEAIRRFMAAIREMPTEYFEAKLPRAVGLSEFRVAVVPDNADKETVDALRNAGLKIVEYQAGSQDAREAAIRRAADENDLLFSALKPEQRRASSGQTASAIRSAITETYGNEVLAKLGDAVQIPESMQALRADMRKRRSAFADAADNLFDGAKGFYDPSTDTSYLLPWNLREGEAPRVLLHEVGVHYGLERMLGEKAYADLVTDLELAARMGGKRFGEALRDVNLAEGLGLNENDPQFRSLMADRIAEDPRIAQEVMGYLVEHHPQLSLAQRIIGAIRAFLRKMGFRGTLRPEDVVALAKAAVRRGKARGLTANAAGWQLIDDVLASTEPAGPWYYSELARVVADAKQAKATPDQWMALLRKSGVKAGEIEWLGVEQWLAEQPGKTVSREDLGAFIATHQVQINEVVLGDPGAGAPTAEELFAADWPHRFQEWLYDTMADEAAKAWDDQSHRAWKGVIGSRDDFLSDSDGDEAQAKKAFVKDVLYAEPEDVLGERLTEILRQEAWEQHRQVYERVSMDHITALSTAAQAGGSPGVGRYRAYAYRGGDDYREVLLTLPPPSWRYPGRRDMPSQKAAKQVFLGGHFGEPNILAHLRTTDHVDTQGRDVLLVEEAQSDWAQQGRKFGYKVPGLKQKNFATWLKDNGKSLTETEMDRQLRSLVGPEVKAWREEQDRALKNISAVPDRPFKQSREWGLLVMKRALRMAAEGGHDVLAWTAGQAQADRYSLSKRISRLRWDDASTGGAGGAGGARLNAPEGYGTLYAYGLGGAIVMQRTIKSSELPDYIGKEAAERLLAANPSRGRSDDGFGIRRREVSGLELNVGGEGMRAFYDQILPNEIKKYAKKWGAAVGETTILVDGEPEVVHAIEITPEMRASAMRGQPLFSRRVDAGPQVLHNGTAAGKGMLPRALRLALEPTIKALGGSGHTVTVVAGFDALPDAIKAGIGGVADAAVIQDGSTLYVVADMIGKPSEVRGILEGIPGAQGGTPEALNRLSRFAKAVRGRQAGPLRKAFERAIKENRLAVVTRRQLADLGARFLPDLRTYLAQAQRMDGDRNALLAESDQQAARWLKWARKHPGDNQALVDLMHDATIAGVDPAEDYAPLITEEEAQEKIAMLEEKARGRAGEGTGPMLAQIDQTRSLLAQERNRARAAPDLQERWAALPAEARRIYTEIRDAYVQRDEQARAALLDRIADSVTEEGRRSALLDRLREQFESRRVLAPYFPLSRSGDYWVSVRDSAGDQVEFRMFESEMDWNNHVKAMEAEGYTVAHGKSVKQLIQMDGVAPGFVADVETLLADLPRSTAEPVQDAIWQLYLQTLPDLSVRKHFIHRKKTPGYDRDAIRAFSTQMFHGGYQLARLRWSHKMEETLRRMEEDIGRAADDDKVAELQKQVVDGERAAQELDAERDGLLDAIGRGRDAARSRKTLADLAVNDEDWRAQFEARRADLDRQIKSGRRARQRMDDLNGAVRAGNAASRSLRQVAGIRQNRAYASDLLSEMKLRHQWAMNPKGGALANYATSFGFGWFLGVSPAAALVNLTQVPLVALPVMGAKYGYGSASRELTRAYTDLMRGGAGVKEGFFSIRKSLEGDEAAAYDELVRDGILDKTLAHDLAGMAEQGLERGTVAHGVMSTLSWTFHKAELANREVVALAAYRLARRQGGSHRHAVAVAANAVLDTQFDYSTGNKARVMQSDTAKVLLLFRQFAQNMTYLLARTAWKALSRQPHYSAAERSEARRALAGILGMTGLAAGATGLPIYPVVAWAVAAALDDEDDPIDVDQEIRGWLASVVGDDAAELLATGAVNQAAGIDLASRVSLANLWWHEDYREREGRAAGEAVIVQAAGPVFAAMIDLLYTGPQLWADGHGARALEKMSPKFVRDVIKSGRYVEEGVTTLRGDPLLPEVRPGEIAAQAIGFTPARLAERYEENSAIKKVERRILGRRRDLLDAYALAYRLGDTERRDEITEAIGRFNRNNPEVAITASTIRSSLKARARASAETEHGIRINARLKARLAEAG